MGDIKKTIPTSMKFVFGIIMIVVYLGMGILMLTDFFYWINEWARIFVGILLIVYGIWRAYRAVKM